MCVFETLMLPTDCYIAKWLFQWSLSNLHHVHTYLSIAISIQSSIHAIFAFLKLFHISSPYIPSKWEKTFEYIMHTDTTDSKRIEKGSGKKINMWIKCTVQRELSYLYHKYINTYQHACTKCIFTWISSIWCCNLEFSSQLAI